MGNSLAIFWGELVSHWRARMFYLIVRQAFWVLVDFSAGNVLFWDVINDFCKTVFLKTKVPKAWHPIVCLEQPSAGSW